MGCQNWRVANASAKFSVPPSFPRSSIAFKSALAVAMLVTVYFAWLLNHAEKWDTPSVVPLVFLCELPLAIALVALKSGTKPERAV